MTALRLREDMPWEAGRKRAVLLGAIPDPREDDPEKYDPEWLEFLHAEGGEAAVGDVWVIRQDPADPRVSSWMPRESWPLIGYGLTCPILTCDVGAHSWTHASSPTGECPAARGKGGPCDGTGASQSADESCWAWSGSVAGGDLTAAPSLRVLGGCEFHGWLVAGVLS